MRGDADRPHARTAQSSVQVGRLERCRNGPGVLPTARRRGYASCTGSPHQDVAGCLNRHTNRRSDLGSLKRRTPPKAVTSSGAILSHSRDGRIELRGPSAPPLVSRRTSRSSESIADARLEPTVLSCAYGARRVLAFGDPANPAVPIRPRTRRPSSIAAGEPNRDGRIRTGDPLNPITLSIYAISREIPGFLRVLEKISWSRNPGFQGSREVTYWRR